MIQFTGEVKPSEETHITADVSGIVKKINVENGQTVKTGDSLFELESERYEIAVRQSEARVERIEQECSEKGRDFQRKQVLKEKNVLTEKDFDLSTREYKQAQLDIKSAKAQLELDKFNLSKMIIRSKITGYFTDLNVFLGQSVNAGNRLGKVIAIDKVYIYAKIPENFINKIKNDQSCIISYGEEGKVEHINLYGDESRSFLVKLSFENKNHYLKPNMFEKGEITISEFRNVPLAPIEALMDNSGIKEVFIVEAGKAKRKKISISGISDGKFYSPDLKENDVLVISGMDKLEDGSEVKSFEVASEAKILGNSPEIKKPDSKESPLESGKTQGG
ncbi:MAG: efflux RND transporter periplasmic adaptor subunit [Candidatus Riflebacteria bacterium]|nr:efflux RND transporter periplasmic adaptor subunit [Candidatus Riflebacteria bacterium]